MSPRKVARRKFWKDLTRTRHMTAVSAVVLGTTFMPLLGIPDIYELRAFQSAVEGFSDARAEAFTPRRNDEAARERSARSVIESDERENRAAQRGADRQLTVERPQHDQAETLDTAMIMPLPPVEDLETEVLEEDEGLPEAAPVEELKPEAPVEAESEDTTMEPADQEEAGPEEEEEF